MNAGRGRRPAGGHDAAIFLLGLFTVERLVETSLESHGHFGMTGGSASTRLGLASGGGS
jgi:hypothetical protein